jgi:hypothetical protein
LLNGGLGEFVRGDVLELDRAPGHLGDGRDLLARGQGLRAGEQVPLDKFVDFIVRAVLAAVPR